MSKTRAKTLINSLRPRQLVLILVQVFIICLGLYLGKMDKPFSILFPLTSVIGQLFLLFIVDINNFKGKKALNLFIKFTSLISLLTLIRLGLVFIGFVDLLGFFSFFLYYFSLNMALVLISQASLSLPRTFLFLGTLAEVLKVLSKLGQGENLANLTYPISVFIYGLMLTYPLLIYIGNLGTERACGDFFKKDILALGALSTAMGLFKLVVGPLSSYQWMVDFLYMNILVVFSFYEINKKLKIRLRDKKKLLLFIGLSIIGIKILAAHPFILYRLGLLVLAYLVFSRELALVESKGVFEDRLMDLKEPVLDRVYSFKIEEIYKDQIAKFLHDDMVQDLILIKTLAENNNNKERILPIVRGLIDKTRDKIDFYKPVIDDEISLKENYLALFSKLRSSYEDRPVLVEFNTDDSIFIPRPYDTLVYTILRELTINAYKHSKGTYTYVDLGVENSIITILVKNYDDSWERGQAGGYGLSLIKNEIGRLGGFMEIEDLNESSPHVLIKVRIPIERKVTDEYSSN